MVPSTDTPIPWMPQRSGLFSDSTPDKLIVRIAHAESALSLLRDRVVGAKKEVHSVRGPTQHVYERIKYTSVKSKSRDVWLMKLHDEMVDIEAECGEAMLEAAAEAQHAKNVRLLALFHALFPRGASWPVSSSSRSAPRTVPRQVRRRPRDPPTPPGKPFRIDEA